MNSETESFNGLMAMLGIVAYIGAYATSAQVSYTWFFIARALKK